MTRTDAKVYAATAFVVGGLTLALFLRWDNFLDRAHGPAAIAMFFFLGVAIAVNAIRDWNRQRGYAKAYFGIITAMVVGAVIIVITGGAHKVFWLELWEISLFAGFWLAQIFQHWRDIGGHTQVTSAEASLGASQKPPST